MHSLAAALDSFNRKERNLLVRKILAEGRLPPLCKPFREQVAEKLCLQCLPEDAWWATDYHISWLAGALALFARGDETRRRPNRKNQDGRRLIEGNQEDVDLVIATGCELILIEAKAYGAWNNAQLKHKLARLELLHEFYNEMAGTKSLAEHVVQFHFLIISPSPPTNGLTVSWPSWACKGQGAPWIELELDKSKSVFEVTRCDEVEESNEDGQFWRVKLSKVVGAIPSQTCA